MHVALGLGKQYFLYFLDVAEFLAAFLVAFIFQIGLAVDALIAAVGVQIFYFTAFKILSCYAFLFAVAKAPLALNHAALIIFPVQAFALAADTVADGTDLAIFKILLCLAFGLAIDIFPLLFQRAILIIFAGIAFQLAPESIPFNLERAAFIKLAASSVKLAVSETGGLEQLCRPDKTPC